MTTWTTEKKRQIGGDEVMNDTVALMDDTTTLMGDIASPTVWTPENK
jgi:hypothetical protein